MECALNEVSWKEASLNDRGGHLLFMIPNSHLENVVTFVSLDCLKILVKN